MGNKIRIREEEKGDFMCIMIDNSSMNCIQFQSVSYVLTTIILLITVSKLTKPFTLVRKDGKRRR